MATAKVLKRIELALNQLPGAEQKENVNEILSAYDEFTAMHVQPFVKAARAEEGTKTIGDDCEKAFQVARQVVAASAVCKKPSDEDLLKFVDPIVQIIQKYGDPKRGDFFHQEKAFGEIIQAQSWLMIPGPKAFVIGQLEAADFYLIKILTEAKDAASPKKENMREFVSTIKTMVTELAEFVELYYKLGLSWNPKGDDLANFQGGAAPAAGGAPAAAAAAEVPEVDAAVLERLEAIAVRLEAAAAAAGGGADLNEKVAAYDTFVEDSVNRFVEACKQLEGTAQIGEDCAAAFAHARKVVEAAGEHKKPSDEDFLKFVDPIVQIIQKYGDPKRGDFFHQEKAFGEIIQTQSWLMLPGPKGFVIGQLEAADFYLIKILTEAKDAESPKKEALRGFVNTMKDMVNGLAEYIEQYWKMGLEWNPKGEVLKV